MKYTLLVLLMSLSFQLFAQDGFQKLGFQVSEFKLNAKDHIPNLTLYHGTEIEKLPSILRNGLQPGSGGRDLMGPGVYAYGEDYKSWTRAFGNQVIQISVSEDAKILDLTSKRGKAILKAFTKKFPSRKIYEIADYLEVDGLKHKRSQTIDYVFQNTEKLYDEKLIGHTKTTFEEVAQNFKKIKDPQTLTNAMRSFYSYHEISERQLDKLVYEQVQYGRLINAFDNLQGLNLSKVERVSTKYLVFHIYFTELLLAHQNPKTVMKVLLEANSLNSYKLEDYQLIENNIPEEKLKKIRYFISELLIDASARSKKRIRKILRLNFTHRAESFFMGMANSKILIPRLLTGIMLTTFLITPNLYAADFIFNTNMLTWSSYAWINAAIGALTFGSVANQELYYANQASSFLRKSLKRVKKAISCSLNYL